MASKYIRQSQQNKKGDLWFLYLAEASIWLMAIYSDIIMRKYFEIPNFLLMLGLAMIFFTICYLFRRRFKPQSLLPKEGWILLLYLIYMIIVGVFVSPNLSAHLTQSVTTSEYTGLMVVMLIIIYQKNRWNSFVLLQLLTALALSVLLILFPVDIGNGQYSISSTMNPNGLGMSFTFGLWAALYFVSQKKLPFVVGAGISALLSYSALLTGSRKSFIVTLLVLVLWVIVFYLPTVGKGDALKAIFKLLGISIITVVIVSFLIKEYSGSVLAERMLTLQYEATEGTRSQMYRNGWELFLQRPLFGYGFQGYSYYYERYSHATLVEIPVSGGIFGTAIYFWAYAVSIKKCLRIWRETRKSRECDSECASVKLLLILWVTMLFYTSCIIHPYQFDSFVIFGIIFGGTRLIEQRTKEKLSADALASKPTNARREKNGSAYIKGKYSV